MKLKSLVLSRFRDEQQFRLFAMLALASFCCGLLVLGRAYINRHDLTHVNTLKDLYWFRAPTFFFLLWNLFLAWIPYLAALKVEHLQRGGRRRFFVWFWLFVWLAFLPNAPYIITDFIHFRHRPPVPFWYDLVLFFTTASLGLTLGLLSLYEIHIVLKRWFSKTLANFLLLSTIGLCGFGVWLGRFQRWNSWDIVTRPEALLRDIADTFSTRHELMHAAGISTLLSGILLVGYGLLTAMLENRAGSKKADRSL
ncbi:MAG: DUF1361 domain-containing protein [Haliscomenobacteraceae bacterium CHB4]|nr:hypothetical protein [Saprospiraceae bacterium]MCE7924221.1 DUF1361 domain-containing protein [Haliscomenobacteraceae bacterium CHB4]